MAYLPPPKALSLNLHYYIPGNDDPQLPPSLTSVLASLQVNQYLVFGTLFGPLFHSARVFNPGTGQPEPYYDAYNVEVGDWLANDATGYTWRVTSLIQVTDSSGGETNTNGSNFYGIMTDVDGFNAGIDPTGLFNGAPAYSDTNCILFTVDEDGFPIFTPSDTFNLSSNFSGNVIGRFRALNTYNQYVNIYQTDASGTFTVGDPVYITNSGLFAPSYGLGDVEAVTATIGVVTSVGVPSGNYFTFNPFGDYKPNLGLGFTGPAGTIYYIDPTGVNQYTTVKPANYPVPMYQAIDNNGNYVLLKGSGSGGGAGPAGPMGPTGPAGNSTGYKLYSITNGNPPSEKFSINATDLFEVTTIKVNEINYDGASMANYFETMSTGTIMRLTNNSTLVDHIYSIVDITNNGSYWTFELVLLVGISSEPAKGTQFMISFDLNGGSGAGGRGPTGPTGHIGATGPTGTVIYTATVFDGGDSLSTYPLGPAFDCGTSI